MGEFNGYSGADIAVIITAISAIIVAFINVRRKSDKDRKPEDGSSVVQGQPVQMEIQTPFESYLLGVVERRDEQVAALRAKCSHYESLLRSHGIEF